MSWYTAVEFCNELSRREGRTPWHSLSSVQRRGGLIQSAEVNIDQGNGYRLPTEAEWEYCCRAGTDSQWCSGDRPSALSDFAWTKENSNDAPHPVGTRQPNAWGLFDMHGNVWELCTDWADRDHKLFSYSNAARTDPVFFGAEAIGSPEEGATPIPRQKPGHADAAPTTLRRSCSPISAFGLSRTSIQQLRLSQRRPNQQRLFRHRLPRHRHRNPLRGPEISPQFAASLGGDLLAHYKFDGSAHDESGLRNRVLIPDAEYRNRALHLDGSYGMQAGYPKMLATFWTPQLDSSSLTVVMRVQAETKEGKPLLIGGPLKRWFAMERLDDGRLRIACDSWGWVHDVDAPRLEVGRWHLIACGIDLARRKCIVSIDGQVRSRRRRSPHQ